MRVPLIIVATAAILMASTAVPTAGAADKAEPKHYNAREAVEAFLAAALAGKAKPTDDLCDPRTRVAKQAKELKGLLRVDKLDVVTVHASESGKRKEALAITKKIQIKESDPDGRDTGRLVLILTKKTKRWLVKDIDFETEESATEELKRFLKTFPDAKLISPQS